jgi:hypothetical protein
MASTMVVTKAAMMAALSVDLTGGARATTTADSKELTMVCKSGPSKVLTTVGTTVLLSAASTAVPTDQKTAVLSAELTAVMMVGMTAVRLAVSTDELTDEPTDAQMAVHWALSMVALTVARTDSGLAESTVAHLGVPMDVALASKLV